MYGISDIIVGIYLFVSVFVLVMLFLFVRSIQSIAHSFKELVEIQSGKN